MKAVLGVIVFVAFMVIAPLIIGWFLIAMAYVAFRELGNEAIDEYRRWRYLK